MVLRLGGGDQLTFGERAQALRAARPDLLLLPVRDGAAAERLEELVEALRFGCADLVPRPRVLLAAADERAAGRLAAGLEAFAVELVPDAAAPAGRLRIVERARQGRRGTDEGLVLRDEALESLAGALAASSRAPALVVDVGGDSTSLVRGEPDGAVTGLHVGGPGSGRGADRVVARAGLERVRRWIPWAVDAPTLLERVFDRARWPDAVAVDQDVLALDIALAHEAIAHALADAAAAGLADITRGPRRVMLTGRLADLPLPAQAALIAADSLELDEIVSLERDVADGLIALAAIAIREPDLRQSALERMGEGAAAVAALVRVSAGTHRSVTVTSAAGRSEMPVGAVPFTIAAQGETLIEAARLSGRARAGSLGVLVDPRPRPVRPPLRDAERIPAVRSWYEAVGALGRPGA